MTSLMRRVSSSLTSQKAVKNTSINPDELAFTTVKKPLTLEDFDVPSLTSAPLSSGVVENDGKVYRIDSGLHVQRRKAWRAHSSGVEVFTFERLVMPVHDGKFRPGSPWKRKSTQVFKSISTPLLTTGDITVSNSSVQSSEVSRERNAFSIAARSLSTLPPIVVQGLNNVVVDPVFEDANLLQVRHPRKTYHTIQAVRVNNNKGISLSGRLENSRWTLMQATYEFGSYFDAKEIRS